MGVQEYSYERHLQYMKEDGYNKGYDNGYNTGHGSGVQDTTALFSWLRSNDRQSDIFLALDNPDYLSQLFEEYESWKKSQ